MKRWIVAVSLTASLLAPVPAQAQDIPQEAEILLWCGSAFRFMGAVAQTDAERANALMASEAVTLQAGELLYAAGFSESEGIAVLEEYDERVVSDFETGDLPYESDECIAVLDFDALTNP